MKNIILYSILFISLQSCISTRSILKDSEHTPLPFSKEQLNGKYKNKFLIWNDLTGLDTTKRELAQSSSEEDIIEIKLISDSELLVQLYCDHEVLDEFIIIGKVKKNHFSLKRYFRLIPALPLFYDHDEYKVLLGNDANGNLIFMEGVTREGWFLFIGAGYSYNKSQIITKL